METSNRTARIRELNDEFRQSAGLVGNGQVLITSGVDSLGYVGSALVLALVARFDDFNEGNDPHGEHDLGAVEYDGDRYFWKIDYYDISMRYGSEDPSDPEKTLRVLTIMRADEY